MCCAGLSLISHTSAELCSLALRFLFHDARKHGLESHPVGMEWIRYVEEAQRCSLGFSSHFLCYLEYMFSSSIISGLVSALSIILAIS